MYNNRRMLFSPVAYLTPFTLLSEHLYRHDLLFETVVFLQNILIHLHQFGIRIFLVIEAVLLTFNDTDETLSMLLHNLWLFLFRGIYHILKLFDWGVFIIDNFFIHCSFLLELFRKLLLLFVIFLSLFEEKGFVFFL
jgi:hypothetical protein